MDALGRVYVVVEFASTVVARIGPSGSAWLFGPSLIHTYCSLPKVTNATGPANELVRLPFKSSKLTRMLCERDSSRFTNISDQFPSGRRTAYDVTRAFPSSALRSFVAGNMTCIPARCCTHSRLII